MKKCPCCTEEVQDDAVKCKYCGGWFNRQTIGSASQISREQQFSNAQPVWHLVVLSILTFGLFEIYWFYRNWKHVKFHKRLDISPGWRLAGLFVPIYGLILVYRQLRVIRNLSREAGIIKTYSPGWILFGWIILNALGKLFWLLSLFSIWPLAVVQGALNLYWKKEQPQLMERTRFTGKQIALLVIGGIWWVLTIIGMFNS